MGHGIIKLGEDQYVEWSTIVDAPVSYVTDRETAAVAWGEERVARADEKGTSYLDIEETAAEYVAFNRAGPNEECLTLEEILKEFKDPRVEEDESGSVA